MGQEQKADSAVPRAQEHSPAVCWRWLVISCGSGLRSLPTASPAPPPQLKEGTSAPALETSGTQHYDQCLPWLVSASTHLSLNSWHFAPESKDGGLNRTSISPRKPATQAVPRLRPSLPSPGNTPGSASGVQGSSPQEATLEVSSEGGGEVV